MGLYLADSAAAPLNKEFVEIPSPYWSVNFSTPHLSHKSDAIPAPMLPSHRPSVQPSVNSTSISGLYQPNTLKPSTTNSEPVSPVSSRKGLTWIGCLPSLSATS